MTRRSPIARASTPLAFVVLTACGSVGGGGAPAIAQPGADGGGGGGDDVASGPGADAGFTDAFDAGSGPLGDGGAAGALGGRFRHGMNSGHVNPNFNDTTEAALGMAAGTDSHRHKLTEAFLDQWGTTIHVAELRR